MKDNKTQPEKNNAARMRTFLKAVENAGNITGAFRLSCIPRQTVYHWMRDSAYRRQVKRAVNTSMELLESEVIRRAKRKSDRLALRMLEAWKPEKYGHRKLDITNKDVLLVKTYYLPPPPPGMIRTEKSS
jgi:hypothetical protein